VYALQSINDLLSKMNKKGRNIKPKAIHARQSLQFPPIPEIYVCKLFLLGLFK
jgi:hypothetical protein